MSLRSITERLRDEGSALHVEAADLIDGLECDLASARDAVTTLEDEVSELRAQVANLEAARLCGVCAFGTGAPTETYCTACGERR